MSKSPLSTFKPKKQKTKKNDDINHTLSNIYSITIRCGNGLNLGKKPVQDMVDWISENSDRHILAVEKRGNACHFQGGIFCASLKRQDNIVRALKPFVLKLWEEQEIDEGRIPSSQKRKHVDKIALKVKPHDSWEYILTYCTKEGAARIESWKVSSEDMLHIKKYAYCKEHDNVLSIYSIASCPKCSMCLPEYHIQNVMSLQEIEEMDENFGKEI